MAPRLSPNGNKIPVASYNRIPLGWQTCLLDFHFMPPEILDYSPFVAESFLLSLK